MSYDCTNNLESWQLLLCLSSVLDSNCELLNQLTLVWTQPDMQRQTRSLYY